MNQLVASGILTGKNCGPDFTYLLHDESVFLPFEYKVLQSQPSGRFVRCMKMLNNGEIQLYYLTGGYKSVSDMLPRWDANKLMDAAVDLVRGIVSVKSNGFLSCQSIDISAEHVYVDPSSNSVRLIYLPLAVRMFEDYPAFETHLRDWMVQILARSGHGEIPAVAQLSADIGGRTLTLEELLEKYGRAGTTPTHRELRRRSLRIAGEGPDTPAKFVVDRDLYVIGRDPERADGVVTFTDTIGRAHCQIKWTGNGYAVTDLDSTNGTYVNGIALQPHQPVPIKGGDMLRLADHDFRVSEE